MPGHYVGKNEDTVHVVRHDDKCIDPHPFEVIGNLPPARFDLPPNWATLHAPVQDLPEEMRSLVQMVTK
jgi:hypothetical protein